MKLSQWLAFSDSEQIEKARTAEGQERFDLVLILLSITNPEKDWGNQPAIETITQYIQILTDIYNIRSLPLYANTKGKDKDQDDKIPKPWEYKDRDSSYIVHAFASHYGWEIGYILDLNAVTAIKLLQEILLSDYFDKEQQYDLSEMAYSYDKGTKKMKHKAMKRPQWMQNDTRKLTVVKRKIPKAIMPLGKVISANELE